MFVCPRKRPERKQKAQFPSIFASYVRLKVGIVHDFVPPLGSFPVPNIMERGHSRKTPLLPLFSQFAGHEQPRRCTNHDYTCMYVYGFYVLGGDHDVSGRCTADMTSCDGMHMWDLDHKPSSEKVRFFIWSTWKMQKWIEKFQNHTHS